MTIPIIETYRGVGIHDSQPHERIERRVKPEIDRVLAMSDMGELISYCGDVCNPPEARLLAGYKAEAFFELAVSERRARPDLDIAKLRASYRIVESQYWRSPTEYCSMLDVRPAPGRRGAEKREVPLRDDQCGYRMVSPK